MEILGQREGKVPAPPTVYRALDFLLEHRLVHRLASQNAFIGCTEPGHHGHGHFLICSDCGNVAELSDSSIDDAIDAIASAHGFEASKYNVEISGVCPSCRPDRRTSEPEQR
jgi:Fur family zinc uptake transcriptional regulator